MLTVVGWSNAALTLQEDGTTRREAFGFIKGTPPHAVQIAFFSITVELGAASKCIATAILIKSKLEL